MEPLRTRGCRAKMPSARLRVAMRMRRCFACLVVDLRGDVCLAGPKLPWNNVTIGGISADNKQCEDPRLEIRTMGLGLLFDCPQGSWMNERRRRSDWGDWVV
jgi:hypothetical protein